MSYIKVFHSAFGDGFSFVGEVDTDSKETAYRLTNNIEDSWVKNQGVVSALHGNRGFRSTSVGDYMKVVNDDGFSSWWRVSNHGFTEVFDETEVELMTYNEEKTERYYETLSFCELRNKYGVV